MGRQKSHQAAGKFHNIHDIVLHGASVGQIQANGLILKFGPEDTGGIQQLHAAVHRHPLLAAGDAGPVLGDSGFPLGHLIDKGGFTHIGHTDYHSPHLAAHLAFGCPRGDLIPQQRTHHRRKLADTLA